MIVDAWVEHQLKQNDSETPKIDREASNEDSE
jgi:hypothetical protein